ncbi:unnamed protein product, partial [Discosporangium mesarthrocarpum]
AHRLKQLRVLKEKWAGGEVSWAISRLTQLERSCTSADTSPSMVVTDFLSAVPLEGAGVTLEHCLEMLPLLERLWQMSSENPVSSGMRCFEAIVRRFGDFVHETLNAPLGGGVDMAREERIERCQAAHQV